MLSIRFLAALALTTALTTPGATQDLTSDCALNDIAGPVETVQTRRAEFDLNDGRSVLGADATLRFDDFDQACNYTSRVLYDDRSEVHWEYWPDEEGRGQRLRTWTIEKVGAPPPPPGPPPPGWAEVPERDRGTRIETTLSPDSTEVFEREITNGVLRKDWVHTLDEDGRVVRSVMLDVDGELDYRIVRDHNGTETVSTYERLATDRRSSTSFRRERVVDEEADERGNWTRRTVYDWDEDAESWVAKEVLTRIITYR